MASDLRNTSSLSNLLLTFLNLTIFLLSSTSFVPILLLRSPPTAFGWALVAVSSLIVLSSSTGFCAQFSYRCYMTHVSLLLASMVGQSLGFFALFLREERCLEMLRSRRCLRETKFLFRTVEGVLLGMFILQSLVLMLSCASQSCGVIEHEGIELEKGETTKKRKRMAQVQVESMTNAEVMEEMEKESDEKFKKTSLV